MVVTVSWINENWNMKSTLLDFRRFRTPHTGDETCALLYEVLDDWDLKCMGKSVNADNATEIFVVSPVYT